MRALFTLLIVLCFPIQAIAENSATARAALLKQNNIVLPTDRQIEAMSRKSLDECERAANDRLLWCLIEHVTLLDTIGANEPVPEFVADGDDDCKEQYASEVCRCVKDATGVNECRIAF